MGCPDECVCGLRYSDFRTGLTFADVKASMWTASTDPEDWVYRTRSGVLGRWRQIKQEMFRDHCALCDQWEQEAPEEFRRWVEDGRPAWYTT